MGVKDLFHDIGYLLKPSRIPLVAALLSPLIAPAVAQTPAPGVVTYGTIEGLDVGEQFVLYSGPSFQTPRDTVEVQGTPISKGYYSRIEDPSNQLELMARYENYDVHTSEGDTTFWAISPSALNDLSFEPVQVGVPSLERLLLSNPYPNPFTNQLARTIEMPAGFNARIVADVYDMQGRNIRDLYDGRAEGSLQITWDGRFNNGQVAAPGVYFFGTHVEGVDDNNKPFSLNKTAKVVKLR
ncbi:MAG: hypothetical protein ABIA93_01125 [Candidatus Woesearchaeota archaeon]